MSARQFCAVLEGMLLDVHGREKVDEILGRTHVAEMIPLTTSQRHALIMAEGGEVRVV